MHGFAQGIAMLNELCDISNLDVILTQEHWLLSENLSYFDHFKENYHVYGNSAMDNIIRTGILKG